MPYWKGFEGYRLLGYALGSAAMLILAGNGFGNRVVGEKIQTGQGRFEVIYPDLSQFRYSPCVAENPDPCAAEAAALAAALSQLDAARATANAMYDAWVDCLNANGGGPDPNDPNGDPKTTPFLEGTFSVLSLKGL